MMLGSVQREGENESGIGRGREGGVEKRDNRDRKEEMTDEGNSEWS